MNPFSSTVFVCFMAAMSLNVALFEGHKFDLMTYAILLFTTSALVLAYALNKALHEMTLFSKDELMLPAWAYALVVLSACAGFYFVLQVV